MNQACAIPTYETLADFAKAIGKPLTQDVGFSIESMAKLHSDVPYRSPLFRTGYYSVVLVSRGRGLYFIDDQNYPIKDGTIYFTNPGHIKGFEIQTLCEGFVITFDLDFLKTQLGLDLFQTFPFLLAEVVPPGYLNSQDFAFFQIPAQQLLTAQHTESPSRWNVVSHFLCVLLYRLRDHFWSDYDPLHEGNQNSKIVADFKHLLDKHFRELVQKEHVTAFQVQDYAKFLGLHPTYLNTVIKKKTGKPVSHWIQERILGEAKALLKRTQMSITEIGLRLGFQEPAHFSRYFKKRTGQSPRSFRQSS